MYRFSAALVLVLSTLLVGADMPRGSVFRQVFLSVEEKGILLIDLDQVRQDPSAVVWSWKAADSPQIAAEHRRWFNGYDECKPALDSFAVLVCSSWSGGIALVRIDGKTCLFYAQGKGAHSAELIGKNLLAAALSGEEGELRLYRLDGPKASMLNAKPAWSMKLPWGHGVFYDSMRDRLYALGGDELIVLRVVSEPAVKAEIISRHQLPKPGGHDLMAYDRQNLAVTVNEAAYLVDRDTLSFSPLPGLADRPDLKSISRHSVTRQVMFTQSDPGKNHTNRLQWTDGTELVLPYKLIYKARWNASHADALSPAP